MNDHLPGTLASVLGPLIVLLGIGLVAVARRIRGERGRWHVYEPRQDGPQKTLARAMLVKEWMRKDLV